MHHLINAEVGTGSQVPRGRFMDVVKKDMKLVGVEDRVGGWMETFD